MGGLAPNQGALTKIDGRGCSYESISSPSRCPCAWNCRLGGDLLRGSHRRACLVPPHRCCGVLGSAWRTAGGDPPRCSPLPPFSRNLPAPPPAGASAVIIPLMETPFGDHGRRIPGCCCHPFDFKGLTLPTAGRGRASSSRGGGQKWWPEKTTFSEISISYSVRDLSGQASFSQPTKLAPCLLFGPQPPLPPHGPLRGLSSREE